MVVLRYLVVLATVLAGNSSGWSEDEKEPAEPTQDPPDAMVDLVTGSPVPLDIARQQLRNFLTDEAALAPYRTTDGVRDLESVFTVGSPQSRYAILWDTESCRLLGALDLKSPPASARSDEGETSSPYVMLASGSFPFSATTGASGDPEYFGFRVVNGKPVFLYTQGSLVVEEQLWLDDGGDTLKQLFRIRDPQNPVSLTLPQDWKERVESSSGEWDDNVLTVTKEEADEFLLTYRLSPLRETEDQAETEHETKSAN